MTYAATETSIHSGSPVELYEFVFGPNHYRYVSGAEPATFLGSTYTPYPIARGQIAPAKPLTLRSSKNLPVAQIFRQRPPSSVVTLIIRRRHLLDVDSQFIVTWQGRVLNATQEGNESILLCENDRVSMRRTGLSRRYQVPCPHALYGPGCGVVAASFAVPTTSYTVTGLTLSVPAAAAFEDNYFAGGFLQYANPRYNIQEYFTIRSSLNDQIRLALVPTELLAPIPLTLFPGCDHTYQTCKDRFENGPNYGGQLFIPNINPLAGGMIF